MTDAWPWLSFVGLGAFHGLNPAMGWLFAVALGLHRQSRSAVVVSLVPIAIGHAVSIMTIAVVLVFVGILFPYELVQIGSGVLLIAWAGYHWRFGHRHRVRFGMQVGLWGLAVWSFLMATAHGAGLMLWPVLTPLCVTNGVALDVGRSAAAVLAGVGLHTLAMLATTGLIAALVYRWLGLALLRSAWFNVDLVWVGALAATGALLLVTSLSGG
jgi:hypothetical protein